MRCLMGGKIPEKMKLMDSNRSGLCFQVINIYLSGNQFYSSFPTDRKIGNLYTKNIFEKLNVSLCYLCA